MKYPQDKTIIREFISKNAKDNYYPYFYSKSITPLVNRFLNNNYKYNTFDDKVNFGNNELIISKSNWVIPYLNPTKANKIAEITSFYFINWLYELSLQID